MDSGLLALLGPGMTAHWLRNLFAARVLSVPGILRDGAWAVGKNPANRSLRRRVVALAAAYAIALSSLIGSFGAARAAAEAATLPGAILCHSDVAGQSTPAPDESNGKICINSCCTGCLMLTAAL